MFFLLRRSFTDPHPDERETLNAVSSLSSNFICSLKLVTICRCSFNCSVRRDVFNCLFGVVVLVVEEVECLIDVTLMIDILMIMILYNYNNNLNECVRIVFPIYLYSYVKFIKLSCNRYDFCETVCVNIIKEHC